MIYSEKPKDRALFCFIKSLFLSHCIIPTSMLPHFPSSLSQEHLNLSVSVTQKSGRTDTEEPLFKPEAGPRRWFSVKLPVIGTNAKMSWMFPC